MLKTKFFLFLCLFLSMSILNPSIAFGIAGDVDGSDSIDIRDVIYSLQIAAGLQPSAVKNSKGDIDNDGKVGEKEAIFALQILAGFRNWPPPLYHFANFPLGSALDIARLDSPVYIDTLTRNFVSVTPENTWKMHRIFMEDGFNFSNTDRIADFCLENNLKLHGHNAVWPEHVPPWVADWMMRENKSKEDLKNEIYKKYIQTMMNRYKHDFITGWDIVNDMFNAKGDPQTLKINGEQREVFDGMGRTIQFDLEDVADFFWWAREANPNAKLYFNESFCAHWRVYTEYRERKYEFLEEKKDKVIQMIDYFQSTGVPIDGIGLQMHISFNNDQPPFDLVRGFIKEIISRGLLVRFSEVDVSMNTNPEENGYTLQTIPTHEMNQKQKARMCELVSLYLEIPPEFQGGITFWGLSDADCWLSRPRDDTEDYYRVDWPVLFSSDYRPKASFFGFINGLEKACNENTLFLQNETIFSQKFYENSIGIMAGSEVTRHKPYGDFVIESGANVTMKGGNIHLEPGFQVKTGGEVFMVAE
jgi:endo-1,4-beta-xylanase